MTLPVSGAISFNDINVELGVTGTTTASLGQSSYRTLAGVPSGAISMSNFYGKSNRAVVSYTFASSTANASLNVTSISGYVAGKSDITVTVNSGVYLYATSTGNYGLSLSGGTTGDTITLVNNGYILGMGGTGGSAPSGGSAGGPAFNLATGINITVNNTNGSAYIAGGGGGGGGGNYFGAFGGGGGGGAGGGAGGNPYPSNGSHSGSGGGPGASGGNGITRYTDCCWGYAGGGGGGGRILPGSGGTGGSQASIAAYSGGGGGAGGGGAKGFGSPYTGGAGGGSSSGGSTAAGVAASCGAGGGGGWGASGGNGSGNASSGGGGGKAVNLNGKSITWTSGNTTRVYGSVS